MTKGVASIVITANKRLFMFKAVGQKFGLIQYCVMVMAMATGGGGWRTGVLAIMVNELSILFVCTGMGHTRGDYSFCLHKVKQSFFLKSPSPQVCLSSRNIAVKMKYRTFRVFCK